MFTDCSDEMTIVREEIFGPVMSISAMPTKRVIRRQRHDRPNSRRLVTKPQPRSRIIHQLEAGICWINSWGPTEMPLAAKHSGIGRRNGVMTLGYPGEVHRLNGGQSYLQPEFW